MGKMKNQYFADVGDYGKYGLLRYIIKSIITVGINWYLTENDPPETIKKQNDGKHIRYLEKETGYIDCDRDLYEFLRDTHPEIPDNRNVEHIEDRSVNDGNHRDGSLSDPGHRSIGRMDHI